MKSYLWQYKTHTHVWGKHEALVLPAFALSMPYAWAVHAYSFRLVQLLAPYLLLNSNGLRSLARNQWIDILKPFFFNISYFLLISLFVVNWFAFVKASIDAHAHMYNA